MRAFTTLVLAAAAFVAATPLSDSQDPSALSRRQGEQLELECPGTLLFCCDPLQEEDKDDWHPGKGNFYNCDWLENMDHGMETTPSKRNKICVLTRGPLVTVSACGLKRECKRTPACCDFPEFGGDMPNPLDCIDFLTELTANNKEDMLICKDGS
ncbi:hypothetical protein FDECE_2441 [Fusarium decemcellulare]|nr:hypothetical protein FDECE_2441 [Fusarium decemcellulare]